MKLGPVSVAGGGVSISQATFVVGMLLVGFVLYLAMNNRLTTYESILGI